MTKVEYQELVKKAVSFKESNAVEQSIILSAEGKQRDFYIKLYQEENDLMEKAALNFVNGTEQVVEELKGAVKKASFTKLKKREAKIRQVEQKKLNNLLSSI